MAEAKIYDQEALTVATGHVFNGSDHCNQVEMKLAYKLHKSSAWRSKLTAAFGLQSHMKSGIPVISKSLDQKAVVVQISENFSGLYEWGESKEETTAIEATYTVEVRAGTVMIVSLTALKAVCDVPFSYTQRDTCIDGRVVTTRMVDGIYTGINCYDFQYEAIPDQKESNHLPLTMKNFISGPSTK